MKKEYYAIFGEMSERLIIENMPIGKASIEFLSEVSMAIIIKKESLFSNRWKRMDEIGIFFSEKKHYSDTTVKNCVRLLMKMEWIIKDTHTGEYLFNNNRVSSYV